MAKEYQKRTIEIPIPIIKPDIISPIDPDEIIHREVPGVDPDYIPEEDPYETPPIEIPIPGERP